MKMFRWASDALGDYSCGEIIVMANDETEARSKVMAQVLKEFSADVKRFEFDLFQKPDIITEGVMLIRGSA